MPALSLQNATGRRSSGGWGGGGGIAIGTADYFPFWVVGGLAGTSQLKNVAGDLLFTRAGVVTPTFTVQAQTTARHGKIVFENLADAKTASIEFNPTPGSGRLTLAADSLFLAGAASAQLSATGLSLHLGPTGFVFTGLDASMSRGDGNDLLLTLDNGITHKKCTIVLSDSADARTSSIEFDSLTNKLTVSASAISLLASPGIATVSGSIVNIVETVGASGIGMTSGVLTYTGGNVHIVRNDVSDEIVTIENQNALHTATLVLKTGTNQASLEFAGNLSLTTVNSFFSHSQFTYAMTGYPLTLTVNGGGNVPEYCVHPAGHYWYGNFGTEAMFLTVAGDLIIHGGMYDQIANCLLTIKGTLADNFTQMYATLAASVSSSKISSDDPARHVELMTWGSGVGGFVIGGISTLKAGALTTLDLDNLVIYTNNSGAIYSPISVGQSAAGAGDRVLLTFDALGNIVFNATYPIYIGDVATNGTHRFIAASGEVNIEKRVAGVYVSDVGTYQAKGTGTEYQLTNAYAAVVFGTTSPSMTIARPGTYLVIARATVYPADTASFTGQTGPGFWFKIRRVNNVAADQTETFCPAQNAAAFMDADTLMHGVACTPAIYTTVNNNDVLEVWAKTETVATAGHFSVSDCSITAVRLR